MTTQTQERPTPGLFDERPAFSVEDDGKLPMPVSGAYPAPAAAPVSDVGLADLMRMAQLAPERDINRLKKEAVRIGREMGTSGYYSFPAGGSRIEGATVWLMEALEGVWRFTFTQVAIERIEGRRVVLRARFIDLKTGVIKERPAFYTMSDPPGKFRGKADQEDRWHAMQLGSAASKAARSVLEHGLPSWFVDVAVEQAKAAAREDLLRGRTLEQAVKETLAYYADTHKVTQQELEALVEQPMALWVDLTILELRDLAKALKEGRTTVEATFGPVREKLAAQQQPAAPAAPEPERKRGAALGLPAAKKGEE